MTSIVLRLTRFTVILKYKYRFESEINEFPIDINRILPEVIYRIDAANNQIVSRMLSVNLVIE